MISFTGIVVYKSDTFYRVPCRKYKDIAKGIQAKLFSEHPTGQESQNYLIKRLKEDKVEFTVLKESITEKDLENLNEDNVKTLKFNN